MSDKLLFVDDEPSVLDGYRRLLYGAFTVETAIGGIAGLEAIQASGPYAVVISDMRMPVMSGTEFLSKARTLAPETVRMVLTGYADIDAAIAAVNQGHVFRFLTKPATKDVLVSAITTGLEQHRLIIAEKELLEKTLNGTIEVLTELMGMVNPAAFGRAMRLRKYVKHINTNWKVSSPWRFEMAAMLSQLGCSALDAETITSAYSGLKLPPEAQSRFDAHPQIAKALLSKIPRLETVASIISLQRDNLPNVPAAVNPDGLDATVLGAHILKVVIAYDLLLNQGKSPVASLEALKASLTGLDRQIADGLAGLESQAVERRTRKCPISELTGGMVLEEDIKTFAGVLLVGKGQEINRTLLVHLKSYCERGAIAGQVLVSVPAMATAQ